jgi:PHD/YefM family antitoxin component YafN of YafNO toxin-antitoxin module
MEDAAKQSDLSSVQRELTSLCRQVVRKNKRVEIATQDGPAVLISKAELQTLEHALEIYASTDDAQRLHEKVAELCGMASDSSIEISTATAAS